MGFFGRRFVLKIPPVCIDKGKPCCLFGMALQEGEKGRKEFQIFFFRQSGYAFFRIVLSLFVKVWRIEDYEVGFSLGIEKSLILTHSSILHPRVRLGLGDGRFNMTFWVPVIRLYLRPCIRPVYHIIRPASPV